MSACQHVSMTSEHACVHCEGRGMQSGITSQYNTPLQRACNWAELTATACYVFLQLCVRDKGNAGILLRAHFIAHHLQRCHIFRCRCWSVRACVRVRARDIAYSKCGCGVFEINK